MALGFFAAMYLVPLGSGLWIARADVSESSSVLGALLVTLPIVGLGAWAAGHGTRAAQRLGERGVLVLGALSGASTIALTRAGGRVPRQAQRLEVRLPDGRRLFVKNGSMGAAPGLDEVAVLVAGDEAAVVLNGSIFPGRLRPPG